MIKRVALKEVLRQYRIVHRIRDDSTYRQVTISQTGEVSYRGERSGKDIGRKRQFIVDLDRHPNTLIFIRQGVFKGGIGFAPPEVNKCVVTENMPMFEVVGIEPRYLLHYLKSPNFENDVKRLVPSGTAQKAIHERQLLQLEVPLPSEETQSTVVSKLDSISEKTEQLSLITEKNVQSISGLRQAIILEAVSGKLVPQDPNDEPASQLMERTNLTKNAERVQSRLDTLTNAATPGIPEEELPSSWTWVRLGSLLQGMQYGTSMKANSTKEEGIPVLRMNNIRNGQLDFRNLKYQDPASEEIEKYRLQKNDILINRTNSAELVGKSAHFDAEGVYTFASYLIRLHVDEAFANPKYLTYVINSAFGRRYIGVVRHQLAGQANINTRNISAMPIPLPPLREQERIVEKIEQLMNLCDELESKILENLKDTDSLMGSVLRDAFGSMETSPSSIEPLQTSSAKYYGDS